MKSLWLVVVVLILSGCGSKGDVPQKSTVDAQKAKEAANNYVEDSKPADTAKATDNKAAEAPKLTDTQAIDDEMRKDYLEAKRQAKIEHAIDRASYMHKDLNQHRVAVRVQKLYNRTINTLTPEQIRTELWQMMLEIYKTEDAIFKEAAKADRRMEINEEFSLYNKKLKAEGKPTIIREEYVKMKGYEE